MPSRYVGRFAPSPTGPLHAGSLVAALASWLDARAHDGRWLLRIEDVDVPRCVPGAADVILAQLLACGLVPDAAPRVQSTRDTAYQRALMRLFASGSAYACGCSRKDIDAAWRARGVERPRGSELGYPGTCRTGLAGQPARSARVLTEDAGGSSVVVDWHDRRLGAQRQDVGTSVGDFVLRRADGLWAYQLAVVVDDADQGVTDIVRGEDLADNTPRQIHLQRLLGLPTPRYLHTPLVRGADGEKLSKHNGAAPLATAAPCAALDAAGGVLGLRPIEAVEPAAWLAAAVVQWRDTVLRRGHGGLA